MNAASKPAAELRYIDARSLLLDSYRLGRQIYDHGFRPTFIVGLWRGGSAVGIAVQECLQYLGVPTDHISVRTSYSGVQSYQQMVQRPADIRVHGLRYLYDSLNATDALLIVDDVFSSGANIYALLKRLRQKIRLNMPQEVRIATPYFRPVPRGKDSKDTLDASSDSRIAQPHYFLHQTQHWLVLPYELAGLSVQQIVNNKIGLREIMQEIGD